MYQQEIDKITGVVTALKYPSITTDNWTSVAQYGYMAVTVHGLCIYPEIDELIEKCKKTVAHFKHSPLLYQRLKETAKRLSDEGDTSIGNCMTLIQECPTRWNSCHDMLSRLQVLKSTVSVVLAEEEILLTPSQWKDLENLVNLLKPMKLIIEMLSGESYLTMSFVYPTIIQLLTVRLSNSLHDTILVKKFKSTMKSGIEKHFSRDEQRSLMEMCTFLDPRFKDLSFLNKTSRELVHTTVKNFYSKIDNVCDDVTESNEPPTKKCRSEANYESNDIYVVMFGEDFINRCRNQNQPTSTKVKLQHEINRYVNDPVQDIKSSPLEWWKVNELRFPLLGQMAKKFLGVSASSVPCERLFSNAGNIITEKRSRLTPSNAEMMIFTLKYVNIFYTYKIVK